MSLTPSNLLADAELLCAPYATVNSVFPGQLLRQLTQLDKEVTDIFAIAAPERLSAAGTPLTVTAAANIAGYSLSAGKAYSDLRYIDSLGCVWPITLINEGELDDAKTHPAGLLRGNTFYPADELGHGWADGVSGRTFFIGDGDTIAYRYIAEPSRVTAMTQTLASPDEVQPYLIASLSLTILLNSLAPAPVLERAAANVRDTRAAVLLMAAKRAGD